MAKDAYYFSHDSNANDDPKCVLLIEQLGLEGYGIYWVLIELLRDQPGYRYPLSLIPAISRRYNTTNEKMKTVITNYRLFEIEDEEFFSLSLMKRMEHLDSKRKQASFAGKKSAEARLLNASSTDVQRPLNDRSTIKVNKTKLNESKVNKTTIPLSENKFSDDAIELSLASELFNLILENNPEAKIPNLQTWAKTFDLMIRRDNRNVGDIQTVMKWCQQDSFWQGNILSPSKLRDKYDQLTIKMKSPQRVDKSRNRPKSFDAIDQWAAMTEGMDENE